ncbi:MAG: tyrosine-type recombinase/integrase [Thermoanaerobaculia bacterium]|nr:tyrosine-type recombinase/integrase [Thermoanaerobaculia bacterium]
MTPRHPFTSWLASHFDHFVALRNACGAKYVSQRRLLLALDRYLSQHAPGPPLRRETLQRYLASLDRLTPRARDNAISVVWSALRHAQAHGAAIEPLPPRPAHPPAGWRQRPARILEPQEMSRLIRGARQLPPRGQLRAATTATVIGLLSATGIRIGEALAIDIGDLDPDDGILTIRSGKFGKRRALPLLSSTTRALLRYLDHPARRVAKTASAPLFVSCLRRRVAHATVTQGLYDASQIAGITQPRPRLHDLRHTFAVQRVAAWYREGREVNRLLPALSTYLGHVSVQNTRRYLTQNGVLLEQAASRFETSTRALDEVRS